MKLPSLSRAVHLGGGILFSMGRNHTYWDPTLFRVLFRDVLVPGRRGWYKNERMTEGELTLAVQLASGGGKKREGRIARS